MNYDRESLGMLVRETWVEWAKEQERPSEHWLDPWELLPEPMKEVDRRIGDAVAQRVLVYAEAEIERLRDADAQAYVDRDRYQKQRDHHRETLRLICHHSPKDIATTNMLRDREPWLFEDGDSDTDLLCTCNLEPFFLVAPDYSTATPPDYDNSVGWVVVDAECERVCTCPERKYAELVAKVLNDSCGEGVHTCIEHMETPRQP